MRLNYRRWLIIGYLLALMAFTTSVLLIPGQKYNTLTTSDSGWNYDQAVDINENNGMVENNHLSHAPYGLPYGGSAGQPLIAVMIYRAIHAISPGVSLMDVTRYYALLLFALTLIPIFLIGKELGGDLAGGSAAFFGAVMVSSIYWMKVGAFDREPTQLILTVWTMYLTIRLFKAPSNSIPTFAVLTGLVYGLFGLSWAGWWYLIPVIIGGLLLVLLFRFLEKLARGSTDVLGAISVTLREHLNLIGGVVGVAVVVTIVLCTLGGQTPRFWVSTTQTLLSYVGIGGGGGGISFTRYASEMATPTSWSATIYKFYGVGEANILSVLIFALITLVLLKFLWSRKSWELLTFSWLITLMGLVWPGKGQARFERVWWPFVPVLAGVGVAVLISLLRRLSFEQFGMWIGHLRKPVLIAFLAAIIVTPFILNAYSTAEHTTPPTEWNFPGLDKGYMDAFNWLRENTPENSVVAIQWSYGHLLTGTARRATVTDGAEVKGEEGKWENNPSFVPRPPDYIYTVRGNRGYIYGMDISPIPHSVNGRRIDVQRLPIMSEDEFRWIINTYRDNYGCKIDYIVFNYREYYSAANYYYYTEPAKILLGAKRINTQLQSLDVEGQNYVFNFGENRENVVLDQQNRGNVYLRANHENLHLDGYGALIVDAQGRISNYGGFFPSPSTVDLPETLLLFFDSDGKIVNAWLIEGVSAEISARPVPMGMKAFTGDLYGIDYLQIAYTSSNSLVKVVKVNHVPSLTSPAEGIRTNDVTPAFRWSSALGAVRYELWVDNDADFSSPEILENVSGTTYTPAASLAEGTHSWRVWAFKADNTELGWSPSWTFTIDTIPPAAAALHAPENEATTGDNTPTLEWTAGAGAAKHRLLVDNDYDFSTPEIDITLDMPENTYTSSELAVGNYWWKVIAIDDANNENESPTWKFTVPS